MLMKSIRRMRARSYWWARFLGDILALMQGPGPFARRMIRKRLHRGAGGFINRKI